MKAFILEVAEEAVGDHIMARVVLRVDVARAGANSVQVKRRVSRAG